MPEKVLVVPNAVDRQALGKDLAACFQRHNISAGCVVFMEDGVPPKLRSVVLDKYGLSFKNPKDADWIGEKLCKVFKMWLIRVGIAKNDNPLN